MKLRVVAASIAALILTYAGTGGALAHASLTSSNIKNGAVYKVGKAPHMLKAFFAEDLDPSHSWINVFEGIADHGLINEKTKSHVNIQNPKEMTLVLPKLAPDKYYFIWYTHSAVDGHWAAGIVYFRVVK